MGRRETENEETKQNEPHDENSEAEEKDDRDTDNVLSAGGALGTNTTLNEARSDYGCGGRNSTAGTRTMSELTAALTQMTALMARMDDRMADIGTAVLATASLQHHNWPVAAADAAVMTTTTTTARTERQPSSQGARQPPETAMQQEYSVAERRVTLQAEGDGDGDDDSSSSSSDSSEDSDDGSGRPGRRPSTVPMNRNLQRNRRRTIRDLDVPTFLPTQQTSVSTWIARVELALTGARLSGCGEWTDQELYYILGPKLQESAGRWWIQLDRKLRDRDRTWSTLKTALTNRYGERPDKSMAEWRVGQRRMAPGGTYADYAAALRDLCGNNRIKERVLLEQFYRSIDRTEIIPANGTTGQMAIIPGVTSAVLDEEEQLALFTNPRGVYNKYTGLSEGPRGWTWDGSIWKPAAKKRAAPAATPSAMKRTPAAKPAAATDKKANVNIVAVPAEEDCAEGDDDDRVAAAPYAQPSKRLPKRRKSAASWQKAATRQAKGVGVQTTLTDSKPPVRSYSQTQCYACHQLGHLAANCPDDEARTRNEAYLARRRQTQKQENEKRVA
ncbi:hypothetical protein PHMEG_00027734 [Phytophthora megakarya]|uniref:CCHC-type domain-containing protein n=1 Tax=Phytophthora megakarya TaxID=4795 RepID=A0A225V7N1_9STRA|nr:hypothetical protein PHMEG_00027734 [Phytophthora megakarya]